MPMIGFVAPVSSVNQFSAIVTLLPFNCSTSTWPRCTHCTGKTCEMRGVVQSGVS